MPDAARHDPNPAYVRWLLKKAGLNCASAAKILGVSQGGVQAWCGDAGTTYPRPCPYVSQYALEVLAANPTKAK